MAFCSGCGTSIADGSTMCAACSSKAPVAVASTGGMNDNLAGALSYIVIVGIIFLLIEPYNKNKFVRFHAFQAIFTCLSFVGIDIVLGFIPIIGWIMIPFVGLGGFILFIVLFIKAYQGQMFKLPFIGDFAEKQANS